MKRLLMVLALAAIMTALMATSALPAFAVSQQGCFGQARAGDASGSNRGGGEGAALSERRGGNAAQNVVDKPCQIH